MTIEGKIADAALTVILDIRYPQAYLALQPAMSFARARAISVDWLPYPVSPLKAPDVPGVGENRSVRHRRFRAEQIAREVEVYAEAQELVLRDVYRAGDSSAFNLGWLWIRHHRQERLMAYLGQAFRAYWAIDFDPASETEVASLIDSLGEDPSGDGSGLRDGACFCTWSRSAGAGVLEEQSEALRERGVFGVPSYLVEEEVFLGRQHLPMIDWILSGRTGRIPI